MEKHLHQLEIRSSPSGIEGYASLWNSEYRMSATEIEKVAPNAFELASEVFAFWNHDQNKIIARTKGGSLQIFTDTKGLGFRIPKNNTQIYADLAAHIDSQIISGASFGFKKQKDRMEKRGKDTVRTIEKATVFEISLVYEPANPETTVQIRKKSNANLLDIYTFLNKVIHE
jgi:HK97 family phage prohead protease